MKQKIIKALAEINNISSLEFFQKRFRMLIIGKRKIPADAKKLKKLIKT